MRDIKRIQPIVEALQRHGFITKLEETSLTTFWSEYPDYRLGQLLINHSTEDTGLANLLSRVQEAMLSKGNKIPLFYIEEAELMEMLNIGSREYTIWGSLGKPATNTMTFKLVKDMDTVHIEEVIEHLKNGIGHSKIAKVMQDELALRIINNNLKQ